VDIGGNGMRRLVRLLVIAATGALAGCATTQANRDPAEGFNRAMFAFNEGLDTLILKPVAKSYEFAVPDLVRTGVGNFFGNIADVFVAVNNLLQGKPHDAASDAARVVFNSTLGVFGIMDVASDMGLEKHNEDFGQTFGRWGAEPGPYVVVPFFGPRNVRDTAGLVLDVATDPVTVAGESTAPLWLSILRLVNDRAVLLPADKVIEEAALDKYSYIRDAYLQRRRHLVFDGSPPREPDSD
jgi:phospholipid-binding lipoprotein MlaA